MAVPTVNPTQQAEGGRNLIVQLGCDFPFRQEFPLTDRDSGNYHHGQMDCCTLLFHSVSWDSMAGWCDEPQRRGCCGDRSGPILFHADDRSVVTRGELCYSTTCCLTATATMSTCVAMGCFGLVGATPITSSFMAKIACLASVSCLSSMSISR